MLNTSQCINLIYCATLLPLSAHPPLRLVLNTIVKI